MSAAPNGAPAMVRPELPAARRLMLLLTGVADNGGAELQAAQLAVWMRRAGWRVTLVSMTPPGQVPPEIAAAGIGVESLDMRAGHMDPRGLMRLRSLVRRERPHVLHAHMTHASLLARALRVIEAVPALVCTLHGARMYTVRGDGWRTRELLHRLTDSLADLTTAVSGEAARHCLAARAVSAGKLRVVPNGVDTRRYRPDGEARKRIREELGYGAEFVWLSTGRFDPVKDHRTLLEAFALLSRRVPGQALLLAGDGALRGEMEQLAAQRELDGRVRFLGHRRDLPALLNGADGFVMSSRFEGLALAVLEASSTGLPVAATRTGGNAEAVRDGVTGLLVEPGDAGALAAGMESLALRPAGDRRWMGLAGRQHVVTRYSVETVMNGWERIYEQLLSRNARRL